MDIIEKLRGLQPLIHHITNTVTINDCANTALALGASPAMVPDIREAPELAAVASALVLNIGTSVPAEITAMHRAGRIANKHGIPVILDPVGVGAMPTRFKTVQKLLKAVHPSIIRGNAAEISFLAGYKSAQRGVDSLERARADAVIQLARSHCCIVVASDEVDLVSDGSRLWRIRGGNEWMGRVCGTGCMSATVQACMAAIAPDELLDAAVSACLLMKLAGEKAAELSAAIQTSHGIASSLTPGLSTFRWALMDSLCWIDDQALETAREKYCEVQDV